MLAVLTFDAAHAGRVIILPILFNVDGVAKRLLIIFHLPLYPCKYQQSYPLEVSPRLPVLLMSVDGLCSDPSMSPPLGLLDGFVVPAVESAVVVTVDGLGIVGTGCEIALVANAVGVVVVDLIRPLDDVLGTWFMREYFSVECSCCCW